LRPVGRDGGLAALILGVDDVDRDRVAVAATSIVAWASTDKVA